MGRGLDGFFDARSVGMSLCSFQGPGEARSRRLSVASARGIHLFPFRTEQLSLSAPMVLGSQGPGRVGRRRSSQQPDVMSAPPLGWAARLTLAHSWSGRVGTGHTHTCARGATAPGRLRSPPRNARRWGCAPPSTHSGRTAAPPSSRNSAKSRTPSTSPRKDRAFGWRRGAERNMCSQARNGLGRNLQRPVRCHCRNTKALQIRGFTPPRTAMDLAPGPAARQAESCAGTSSSARSCSAAITNARCSSKSTPRSSAP